MATYLVISLGTAADLVDAAVTAKIIEEDRLQIESGKWLIYSTASTTKDLSDKLGLSESVTFFSTPVRGYFGRARPDIWEWLAAKATKTNGRISEIGPFSSLERSNHA